MSKCDGNTTCILSYPINSASRLYHEVLASQFPFLQNCKDTVPTSKVCLYSFTNWSLAQAHQQSSFRLNQSSTSVRGSRTKPKPVVRFFLHLFWQH